MKRVDDHRDVRGGERGRNGGNGKSIKKLSGFITIIKTWCRTKCWNSYN